MCTHNQYFEQNKKNIKFFHLKIDIFTAVKYCCILHSRVFVMFVFDTADSSGEFSVPGKRCEFRTC